MHPDGGQGTDEGWCLSVCHEQTGRCVAVVNEMGGYQGKQASLSPV